MIVKKLYVIILLLSLTGFSSFAQEQDEKTRKNSISVDYGIIGSRNRYMYSYNVNLCYRRNVWNGLGIGAVYQYYKYDFDFRGCWPINTHPPIATICAHSALFRIDYELPISRHVSLLSFCQFGTDWKHYRHEVYGTAEEKDHEFVYSRGFQLEWCYSAFSLYFQYEYCLPKIGDIKGNNFYMIDEHSLEYRSFGGGLRFKF